MTDRSVNSYKELPCYVIWGLWLTRNKYIFEGSEAHLGRLTHKIKLTFGKEKNAQKQKFQRNIQTPDIDFSRPWGFFDGSCQGHPQACGAGALLYLSKSHFSLLNMEQERVQIAELNFMLCGYCLKWLKINR